MCLMVPSTKAKLRETFCLVIWISFGQYFVGKCWFIRNWKCNNVIILVIWRSALQLFWPWLLLLSSSFMLIRSVIHSIALFNFVVLLLQASCFPQGGKCGDNDWRAAWQRRWPQRWPCHNLVTLQRDKAGDRQWSEHKNGLEGECFKLSETCN